MHLGQRIVDLLSGVGFPIKVSKIVYGVHVFLPLCVTIMFLFISLLIVVMLDLREENTL